MIRRGPRPADQFAMIANAALEDQSLTWRARGVLAYLLSRPEGWSTSAERLATQSPKGKEGRDAMRSVLAELETAGYLVREKVQDARGRWSTGMVVYDFPAKNTPEPPTVEPTSVAAGVLYLPDTMAVATDVGSDDEMVEIAAELMAQPLVLESAKNGGSPGVGKPAVGQPAVGKPGPINKKENKKENKTQSTTRSLKERMAEARQNGGNVAPLLAEITESLGWAPTIQDLAKAEKTWPWAHGGWKSVEIARDYVLHCRAKGWTPTTEGWLSSMEFEHNKRERQPRRIYGADGVPL